MLKRLQDKAGYVSIETVIVASFVIVVGFSGLSTLSPVADLPMYTAVAQLNDSIYVITGGAGTGGITTP